MSRTIYVVLVTSRLGKKPNSEEFSVSQVAYDNEADAKKFVLDRCSGEHDVTHCFGQLGFQFPEWSYQGGLGRYYKYEVKEVEVQ